MIKIHFFAGLKRFFPSSQSIPFADGMLGKDILEQLKKEKPDAIDLLSKCRVAYNEEFISLDEEVKDNDEIFLIPPSSGG